MSFVEVHDRLFLGMAANNTLDAKTLQAFSVTHVVHLTGKSEQDPSDLSVFSGVSDPMQPKSDKSGTAAVAVGLVGLKGWEGKYHSAPLRDVPSQDIGLVAEASCEFIVQALSTPGAKVVVVTDQGVSRGPAVVLYYLIKHQKLSLKDAFAGLQRKWKTASPNNGFMRQLLALEKVTHGSTTVDSAYFQDDWGFGVLELLMLLADSKTDEQKQEAINTTAAEEYTKVHMNALEALQNQFSSIKMSNKEKYEGKW